MMNEKLEKALNLAASYMKEWQKAHENNEKITTEADKLWFEVCHEFLALHEKTRWRSIEDGLPEESGEYLCYGEVWCHRNLARKEKRLVSFCKGDRLFEDSDEWHYFKVLFWMASIVDPEDNNE